ncbi:DUF2510 domain-containing protein [Xiamenia xianingshaonis]|uniref:DUF2510 domain-containing protein n=1 Tax=Xiamenia xianingshaonis TaxID=2682776 RepID=A0A9E6MQ60_9ACTN|nr:DUF2510 domain-containing protein [Xiamenia xianingshaonis]QTU84090.1 DUF2510 domain-containing protein [Xiamenia xianingshaonis]
MGNPQAGWYPDPSGDVTKLRYWDGLQWTDNFTDAAVQTAPGYAQPTYPQPGYGQPGYAQTYGAENSSDATLRLVAFILNVVSTVSVGWAIIPLAWMIPICVRSWNIYKGTRPNTTAFGVVDLIFGNLVAGILLLVSKKEA